MERSGGDDDLVAAKTELIAELRRENEKILEEYKLSLQKEFKQQLEQVTLLALSRPGHTGNTVVEYDRNASKSFQVASLSSNNQPKIHVYEQNTGKRSAVVRSSKEELTLPTKHLTVRTSGSVIYDEIEEIVEPVPLEQAYNKVKQQPEAPEHLKAKYGSPISPLTMKKPKKLSSKKLTEDTPPVVDSPGVVASPTNIQEIEKKFDGVTKFFLRKSEMLIKDAMTCASPSPSKKKSSKHNDKFNDSPGLGSAGNSPLLPSVHATNPDSSNSPITNITRSKLPKISSSKGAVTSPSKKGKMKTITDYDSSASLQQPPRPPSPIAKDETLVEWETEHKRVNNIPPELETNVLTSDKWENDIARHILSVFATQKTNKDKAPATHLMEYVDTNRIDSVDSIKSYINSTSNVDDTVQDIINHDKKTNAYSNASSGDPGHGKSKINSMRPSQEDKELTEEEKMTKFITDLAKSSKYRTTIMARTQMVECDSPTRVDFRYRSKPLRKGVEVALRSSPKVYQIWFISTGELDTNWSMLPGGKALQAQLTQSYENKQFSEYLQTIEALILQLWSTVSGYVADSSAIAGRGYKIKEDIDLKSLNQPKVIKKNKKNTTAATGTVGGDVEVTHSLTH